MKQGVIFIVIIISIISAGCTGTPPVTSTPAPTPSPAKTPTSMPAEKAKFFAAQPTIAYTNGEIYMYVHTSDPVLISSMRWIVKYYPRENKTYEITEYSNFLVNGITSNSSTEIPPQIAKVIIRTGDRWEEGQQVNLQLYEKASGKMVETYGRPVSVKDTSVLPPY